MSQQTGPTFPKAAPADRDAIIAEALAFFLRPRLLQSRSHDWQGQFGPLLALLGLNLSVLFLLLPLLIGWTHITGIEPPRMMRDVPEAAVLVLAVLVLPPLEEIVFRGWMSGRPAALLALGIGLVFAMLLALVHRMGLDFTTPTLAMVSLGAAVAGAWVVWRKDQVPQGFSRNFKWFFWGSTLLFASAHYTNYAELTPAHLPLVLPQFWSGLVFGFTRMRFGLSRSIALHCTSNALVLVAFFVFGLPAA